MTVRLRTKARALVRVNRAVFIGDVVQELLRDLTAGDHHPLNEIVELGIVKNHYIGEITVRFLLDTTAGSRKQIAEISISLDWEQHKLNISGLGEEVEICPDTGKIEQVSAALVRLVGFLNDYRIKTGAATEIVWTWAPGVDAEEAQKVMKTQQAELFQWLGGEIHDFGTLTGEDLKTAKRDQDAQRDLEYELSVTPRLLDEMTVRARVTDIKRVLKAKEKEQ